MKTRRVLITLGVVVAAAAILAALIVPALQYAQSRAVSSHQLSAAPAPFPRTAGGGGSSSGGGGGGSGTSGDGDGGVTSSSGGGGTVRPLAPFLLPPEPKPSEAEQAPSPASAEQAAPAPVEAEYVAPSGDAKQSESSRSYHYPAPPVGKNIRGILGQLPEPGPNQGIPVPFETAYAGQELWIIEKPAQADSASYPGDIPGSGELRGRIPGQPKEVPLPLKHTDVKGTVSAYIGTVYVKQQYRNPYDSKIEAVYVFPLPQDAAVNDFLMVIGDRRIRGIIREREEARQIYETAKSQGHVASLLTQERPNIFTQSVANIEPGKAIDIEIRYFHTLQYSEGEYEFVFPMVVGPRFNPPGATQGVGAVAHGKRGASGQSTEIEYLRPNERSGHDISLSLEIDAGVKIENVRSPSHAVEIKQVAESRVAVNLSSLDSIPNKDFVLRYRIAGKVVKSALLVHRDPRGKYFTLMLQPPEDLRALSRSPMEMIFVLDCSGSMNGWPIQKAKEAIARALKGLQPQDTFQLIQFSIKASQLGSAPIPASPENVRKGLDYLASLQGEGGTMMIEGIKAALDFSHDPKRFRIVSFMTDGFIGNEYEILGEMHKRLGDSRVFSFGVGAAPNRFLLDRMALLGRGAVAYVGPDGGSGLEAVDQFYERISHPALADIRIDWGGMEASDIYPSRIPDLFVGRPVILTGRFNGQGRTSVKIEGRAGSETRQYVLPIDLNQAEVHQGIPEVWARTHIADMENRSTNRSASEAAGFGDTIRHVALEFGLMSGYTSFIAVDSLSRTAGTVGTTVRVPVPVPEGVKYETTVQE